MELKNTKKLMEKLKENKALDSYAVMFCKNGEKTLITSDNVDENTYFDVASMGKVLVTATLALKAIDKGILSLDDTLDKFFDNVPEEKQKITVRQILTHTSGIIRSGNLPDRIADCGREAVVWHILNENLAFLPGMDYTYSCNAYILLGFILEKILGMPLDKLYSKYITEPFSLKRSCFNIKEDEENAAVCYRYKYMGKYRVDDENVYTLGGIAGNGASQSSVLDISKFIDAVLNKDERIYSKELFEKAETNYTPNYEEGRGLGYLVTDKNYAQTGKLFPIGSFGHCGHTGQSFFINREKNMYAIILTNATRFAEIKTGFKGHDYGFICKMREDIHNAIFYDLNGNI